MPIVSKKLTQYAPEHQTLTDIVGSIVVGVLGGAASLPFDLWKNQKQLDLLSREKPLSYKTIIQENSPKKIGWKGAFRGAAGRSFACSLAIFCMTQGMRYIEDSAAESDLSNKM